MNKAFKKHIDQNLKSIVQNIRYKELQKIFLITDEKLVLQNPIISGKNCEYIFNKLKFIYDKFELEETYRARIVIYNSFNRYYKSHILTTEIVDDEATHTSEHHFRYYKLLKEFLEKFHLYDYQVPILESSILPDVNFSKSLDIIEFSDELVKYYLDKRFISTKEFLAVNGIKVYTDQTDSKFLYHDSELNKWFKVVGQLIIFEKNIIEDLLF
jgi:hypothetical protein